MNLSFCCTCVCSLDQYIDKSICVSIIQATLLSNEHVAYSSLSRASRSRDLKYA